MRRHALHIAAALLCFSLGMLVTDGYGRLAYALPLSLLCFLLTKTLPRVEIDFHFLMVVSMSLLLWSAGVSVIGWYFSEPFGDCVLTSDSSDFYVGCSTDAAAPKPADKPPTGLTVYTCTDADPSPLSFNPIWVGVVDKKALRKPAPLYSPLAKEVRPASTVAVSVLIDTSGNVLQAQAISGHPLLRQEAAEAACRARFPPALIDGARPPAFGGILTYESPR